MNEHLLGSVAFLLQQFEAARIQVAEVAITLGFLQVTYLHNGNMYRSASLISFKS